LTLKLPFRPPLDWHSLLRYLKGRQTAGVEVIDDDFYSRSIRVNNNAGIIIVTRPEVGNYLALTIQIDNTTELMGIVRRVRRIFDLEADPMYIESHLMEDPKLSPLVSSNPGLRIPGGWDTFEIAIRAVIGQQISIPAANTITARLVAQCGTPVDHSLFAGITHLFPLPEQIVSNGLEGIGLPGKRIETLLALSSKVANGEIRLDGVVHPGPVKERLMEIPGIGRWTAEYVSMRALREPDAFPAADLALKRMIMEKSLHPDFWHPWRAYAAMHLWNNY
jgi:3-methyladenine DNA glycosylase/8-oxoguanine DNA glycosylase